MSRKRNKELKKLPRLMSDREAEDFVDAADLSEYDLSGLKPVRFEFLPKDKSISLRLPAPMIAAVRERARRQGMSCQKYIRQVLADDLAR
jgi:predicted DNA binding CopG/RHH family protein